MKQIFCIPLAALILTACGSKDVEVLPADTVALRITSEVPAGVKAQRISVIPNDVAPWLSQILLLADGQLYRTTANGGKAQAVNGGTLKDMIGLMREGAAGTVLTLTSEGKLTAMIEKDDEGRLARMNVSSKADSYGGFCQTDAAPSDTVTAYSSKSLITLQISYEGNELMTVEEMDRASLPKAITACFVSGDTVHALAAGQLFSGGNATGSVDATAEIISGIGNAQAPTLLYMGEGTSLFTLRAAKTDLRRKVVIQDGLSVMGTENFASIFTTSDSLGGTFSQGAVIAQDENSDRLVLVSLPFADQTLSKQTINR